jgi:hypothetical protein
MSAEDDGYSARADAKDNRRWLIGIGISVAFGLFGVVMALLSYADRIRPPLGPAANTPAKRASEPTRPSRERNGSSRHESSQPDRRRP